MVDRTPDGGCEHFIEMDDPWAGTYCKLPTGHVGNHSAHYPPVLGRCEAVHPKPSPHDPRFPRAHYERCIRSTGHVGRHDDVYGRWWGKVDPRAR